MRVRAVRRMVGLLRKRLPEVDLEVVAGPRAREGRWSLGQILRATLVGLMAGCRSLWETEQLTETLSPAARRLLSLPRRLADTTARDALCRVSLDDLRAACTGSFARRGGASRSNRNPCPFKWWRSTAR
jgi:hypothetical protein